VNSDERIERVRQSAAGLLYVRNRLAGELTALRSDGPGLEGARTAGRFAEIERVERELAEAQADARQALAALATVHEVLRVRERQQLRARAAQLSVTVEVTRELSEDPLEARFRALERR
jgi:hypothetical protein